MTRPNTTTASVTDGPHGTMALRFAGISRPVVMVDAAEVIRGIGHAVKGWDWTAAPATAADLAQPLARITRRRAGFAATSVYLEAPMRGLPAASAVCSVLADLSEAVFDGFPTAMALHAGAVQMGDRVIAFAGQAWAGKSTLMARMTAEPGVAVYCDDVLPVLPSGEALALGFAPRTRLPLPAGASPAFRAHVAASAGISDDRYAYVTAPAVAPHGTRARLGALVILDRRPRGPVRFHAVEAAEAAANLLMRDMQAPVDAVDHLEKVARLAETVPCLRLVYSDLEDAVAAIRPAFGGAAWPAPDLALAAPLRRDRVARVAAAATVDPGLRLTRDPMAAPRNGPGGLWLVRRGGSGRFHLNAVAAAVWELLSRPATGAEIAADLAMAFPEASAAQIAADVGVLLGGLLDAGLITVAELHPAGGRIAVAG